MTRLELLNETYAGKWLLQSVNTGRTELSHISYIDSVDGDYIKAAVSVKYEHTRDMVTNTLTKSSVPLRLTTEFTSPSVSLGFTRILTDEEARNWVASAIQELTLT